MSDMIKRFIFERVSENIITKPWMKACYRDSQTREIVMAAWPLNYAITLAWMLNLAWQRYRYRESWIDRMVASEARLKIIQLERERDEKQEIIRRSCVDWAEDHTRLQNLCREVGATEHEVEGDSYGEETARVYCQNSDYHREMREKAEHEIGRGKRERAQIRKTLSQSGEAIGNGDHDYSIIEMVEKLIQSKNYFIQKSDSVERERDEAIAARKASAADWRNQLVQMGKCVSSEKRMAALAVKERTEMLEALMKIEDVLVSVRSLSAPYASVSRRRSCV
jgi:hypothetical protein